MCLLLGVSKRSLQYYRNNGIVPYSFIGGKAYFKADAIRTVLEKELIKLKGR